MEHTIHPSDISQNFIPYAFSFTSNSFDNGVGFQLAYEATMVPPLMTYRIGTCGGDFKTKNGLLTSPSYPYNYPALADCTYTISQPNDMIIIINILLVDISDELVLDSCNDYWSCNQEDKSTQYKLVKCEMAYLEVRDGASEQSPLIDGYCGDGTDFPLPITLQPTKNNAFIR